MPGPEHVASGPGRRPAGLRRAARLAFVSVVVALAACASPVRNAVTVYHEWPASLTERTFRIADPEEGADDLAYRTFRAIVRDRLVAAGFVPSPRPALEVAFSYRETRETGQVIESVPVVTSHVSIGSWWRHGGLSVGFPLYWGWPAYEVARPVNVYERRLTLEIADLRAGEPRRVYQASASNQGGTPAAAEALPYLVDAILDDFPGRSGVARHVSFERRGAQ